MTFAERPRCLRVAWALDGLFNGKSGYAYPVNAHLANMTGLPINKVQEALLTLESDCAIVRLTIVRPNGQEQRVIYPANALIPTPTVGVGVTPTVGVGGHPQQVGVHNLIKRARLPKTERERARLAAKLREERAASERDTDVGCPSSEATGDGKGTRLTEEATIGISRSGSAADDMRRKAKGAAGDRPRDAGGRASDRSIAEEEEGEWTL
jgi:hypothetical protein